MARRSLSDQRHLLVELELDDGVLRPAYHHHHDDAGTRHPWQDAAVRPISTRPPPPSSSSSATLRRTSLDHKTPSPYKLKQKVLSSRSRSRQALDREVDHEEDQDDALLTHRRRPSARRHDMPSPSPLLVIADAIRDNVTQRSRVLLGVQDELRRLPVPSMAIRSIRLSGAPLPLLLSTNAIKLLNRLRSLTLSVVEMVRYFYEQLASTASKDTAALWALQFEFQETLARLCASDVDGLLAFPSFARFFEALGVSALRNPLLDGVSLDASELLLCSYQATGTRSSTANSSLFQLVVARLEAFAVQVRRQYPAWQLLPHDRVARALLDLLESENKPNATRLLPRYLRPDGHYLPSAMAVAAPMSAADSDEDDEADSIGVALAVAPVAPVKSQAWADVPAPQQPSDPPRRVSRAQVLSEAQPPAPAPKPSPRPTALAVAPNVALPAAEPKARVHETTKSHSAKKAKQLQERSVTLSSLGVTGTPSAMARAETKDPCQFVASDDDQRTRETIASALDKLPQFSLESLGMAAPRKAVEPATGVELAMPVPVSEWRDPAVDEHPVDVVPGSAHDVEDDTAPSLPSLPSPDCNPEEQEDVSPNTDELSRIMSLCRDVQVAAIDLGERLHPMRFNSPVETAGLPSSPRHWPASPRHLVASSFTLSTRYLERELKMLRRCFRLWAAARLQRHERLVALRSAWAARQLGRFGRRVVRRQRARATQRTDARRHQMAARIQRRVGVWLTWQQTLTRQRAFHLVHRCFRRYRFFTHVAQRQRRRNRAGVVLQRWWRRTRRRWRAAEQRRQAERRENERRVAAARHLQSFVRERRLRRKLAEAEEANRRNQLMQNIKAMKARQDETKRRQVEAKRLAELRVAMQLSVRAMETKWKEAEAHTQRLQDEHALKEAEAQRTAHVRTQQHAREQIDRFLERSVLRRRLRAAVEANAAISLATRQLEFVRARLERQHRGDHARRLLQGRMRSWKGHKTQQRERSDARDALGRLQRQRARDRDEANQKLQAQIRARVAVAQVLHACGVATHTLVATAYNARLTAKREEAVRLRRQAARERIASFVERWWLWQRLVTAQRAAEKLRLDQEEAAERKTREREQRRLEQLRAQSERVVTHWLTQQVLRQRAKHATETVKRAAEEATRRATERWVAAEHEIARLRAEKELSQQQHQRRAQLVKLQKRKSEMREQQRADKHARPARAQASSAGGEMVVSETQHTELLAQLQRHAQERWEREAQLQWERQARALLVDVIVDTQRVAQHAATQAVFVALSGVRVRCESLVFKATYHHVMARAWHREVCWRWRQFVRRRRALAALATHMLWPQASPSERDILALPRHQQQQIELRDARLAELKRVTAVRRVQRCWRASRKRLRQQRRLEVKRAEDALVAKAKRRGSAIFDQQLIATASAARTLTQWAQRVARKGQLRFVSGASSSHFTLYFAGGRAWATTTLETVTTRLRFDRAATRRLLQAVDPAAALRSDRDRLLQELCGDLVPIVATAKTSPRAIAQPDGALELGDVDEAELPRFALVTRQLSKTRSMAKRKQLLDAKAVAATPTTPAALTVFDAVESASLEDAHFLLLQGEDLHAREPCRQRTALHMLAFSGECVAQRVALLHFLVERAKLDLYARDDSGATPLMTFATHGCVALVDTALQLPRMTDLWREIDHDGRNAFHCACMHDQPECAEVIQQFVLSKSEPQLRELYITDKRGAMPLHTLAALGHRECLRAVLTPLDGLSKKMLLDQHDSVGRTPLHRAVANAHVSVAQELVACGASVCVGDAWQRRPLHFATRVAATAATELISLLVDHAAEPDATDVRGDTALHWAATSGRAQVVRQLLVLGADPHVLNGDWETPANVAAANRHGECTRLLLPASVSASDLRGTSMDHHHRNGTHELASAHSYYLPSTNGTTATADTAAVLRKGGEIDWDELHQGVELVEESGHFSSEDERGDADDDDPSRWYSDDDDRGS